MYKNAKVNFLSIELNIFAYFEGDFRRFMPEWTEPSLGYWETIKWSKIRGLIFTKSEVAFLADRSYLFLTTDSYNRRKLWKYLFAHNYASSVKNVHIIVFFKINVQVHLYVHM
jgi:hypothetical protein